MQNEPAFPQPMLLNANGEICFPGHYDACAGISTRTYMATAFASALLPKYQNDMVMRPHLAKNAVALADELIAELNK